MSSWRRVQGRLTLGVWPRGADRTDINAADAVQSGEELVGGEGNKQLTVMGCDVAEVIGLGFVLLCLILVFAKKLCQPS